MRKLFAFLIIIICVGVYYSYTNGDHMNQKEKPTEFEKIMEISIKQEEFDMPEDIIIRNNRIVSYLYGGKIDPEEIEPLVSIQRNLFDTDLLEMNPLEIQVEKVKFEIEENKEKNFRIIQIKHKSAQYEQDNTIARIKVIQYTNAEHDNYVEYYLRKQVDNTWRILGWKMIDEFDISEEI